MSSKVGVNIKEKTIRCVAQLRECVLLGQPILIVGSQTSTVIPYESLNIEAIKIHLSSLPKQVEYNPVSQTVLIKGPVTWEEVHQELLALNIKIASAPTEKSAQVLAGIATSCSGEDCFCHGNLRDQIVQLKFINDRGEECILKSDSKKQIQKILGIEKYQRQYSQYAEFKNAPYPRLEVDTDLMVGSEGQLGIIMEAEFKTVELFSSSFVLIPTESWRTNKENLIDVLDEILNLNQVLPNVVLGVEFFDRQCMDLIKDTRLKQSDHIAIEVKDSLLVKFSEQLFSVLASKVEHGEIQVLDAKNWDMIRTQIPRGIVEKLSKYSLIKKGTDIQTTRRDFVDLLKKYQELVKDVQETYMFGHLGNFHLHLNFLPNLNESEAVDKKLTELYSWSKEKIIASPFAEHGIGVIKQKYISNFWTEVQYNVFKALKKKYDPRGIFFPQGYMMINGANS